MDDLKTQESMEDADDVEATKHAREETGEVPLETIKAEMGLSTSAGKTGKSSRRNK